MLLDHEQVQQHSPSCSLAWERRIGRQDRSESTAERRALADVGEASLSSDREAAFLPSMLVTVHRLVSYILFTAFNQSIYERIALSADDPLSTSCLFSNKRFTTRL